MDYIIGAGAILESGEHASIAPANLHARVDPALAARVAAAAIDFESTSASGMRKLLVLVPGFDPGRFQALVGKPLRERGDCSLADVFVVLARAAGVSEVHLFAHWLPGEETCAPLQAAGLTLVAHPLEVISEASIVAGQRVRYWRAA
jgi:hypothetical protein